MCDCISYNGQVPGQQGTPEVLLAVPDWVTRERRTVAVDACIADHIKALWEAGIWTEGCCCGHNGQFPRNVIVDRENHVTAQAFLDARQAGITVMSWQLRSDAPNKSGE